MMPMSDSQIRAVIEQQLARFPGTLYGAAQNAQRNANGERAFETLKQAALADIETAVKAEEGGHASAR